MELVVVVGDIYIVALVVELAVLELLLLDMQALNELQVVP
jgi:hypothetical protein